MYSQRKRCKTKARDKNSEEFVVRWTIAEGKSPKRGWVWDCQSPPRKGKDWKGHDVQGWLRRGSLPVYYQMEMGIHQHKSQVASRV